MERNVSIAQARLAGATYKELEEQFSISQAHISRILNDDEIKDVIETGTKHLVTMVPRAMHNYQRFLDPEYDDKSIHYKASKDCLQTTGILASHTQSQTINNIFQQQNNFLSPESVELFAKSLSFKRDQDVTEGEVVEDNLNKEDDD